MTHAIIATARNEGPFLVEWLAHHIALGFDAIFVATNSCDDGTDDLLDALGQDWPIHRVENPAPHVGGTIQRVAVRRCLADPRVQSFDWLLHIDVDEFLNIQTPDPSIRGFTDTYQGADAILLCWRLFGDNGRGHWDGGSVLDGFLTCQDEPDFNAHKVLFRRDAFGDVAPHSPKSPLKPLADVRVVNSRNQPLDSAMIALPRRTALGIAPELVTWRNACVHHYIHKSHDLSRLALFHRGDANGRSQAYKRRKVGSGPYEALNRNDTTDHSIALHRPARLAIQSQMLLNPAVLRAHYESQMWFMERLLALKPRDHMAISRLAAQ